MRVILLAALVLSAGCVSLSARGDELPAETTAPSDTDREAIASVATPVSGPVAVDRSNITWTLTTEIPLGWVAVVGAGFAGDHGLSDATHCPTALFTVPLGATMLTATLRGELADPKGGAGSLFAIVTDPVGAEFQLDPYLFEGNPVAPPPASHDVAKPTPGDWTAQLRGTGPAVNQSWALAVGIAGESLTAPELVWQSTCA